MKKNKINFAKHGIDFETAMLVFNDLQRIEIYDMEHSKEEDRYNTSYKTYCRFYCL